MCSITNYTIKLKEIWLFGLLGEHNVLCIKSESNLFTTNLWCRLWLELPFWCLHFCCFCSTQRAGARAQEADLEMSTWREIQKAAFFQEMSCLVRLAIFIGVFIVRRYKTTHKTSFDLDFFAAFFFLFVFFCLFFCTPLAMADALPRRIVKETQRLMSEPGALSRSWVFTWQISKSLFFFQNQKLLALVLLHMKITSVTLM